jgi:hypothetical protein
LTFDDPLEIGGDTRNGSSGEVRSWPLRTHSCCKMYTQIFGPAEAASLGSMKQLISKSPW